MRLAIFFGLPLAVLAMLLPPMPIPPPPLPPLLLLLTLPIPLRLLTLSPGQAPGTAAAAVAGREASNGALQQLAAAAAKLVRPGATARPLVALKLREKGDGAETDEEAAELLPMEPAASEVLAAPLNTKLGGEVMEPGAAVTLAAFMPPKPANRAAVLMGWSAPMAAAAAAAADDTGLAASAATGDEAGAVVVAIAEAPLTVPALRRMRLRVETALGRLLALPPPLLLMLDSVLIYKAFRSRGGTPGEERKNLLVGVGPPRRVLA